MCRSVRTLVSSWRRHKRGDQVCVYRAKQGVLRGRTFASISFSPRTRRGGPGGIGRARVHFPCTHTPSTIRRPLAASTWNAIPDGGRAGRAVGAGRGGEGEDKVPGVGGTWEGQGGSWTKGGEIGDERGLIGECRGKGSKGRKCLFRDLGLDE